MANIAATAIAKRRREAESLSDRFIRGFYRLGTSFAEALETEAALRRPFLWLPVASGAGVICYLCADHEPNFWVCLACALAFAGAAFLARSKRVPYALLLGLCALFAGEVSASWRSARVAAPVLDRVTIATVEGFIEEINYRPVGARFLLRIIKAEGFKQGEVPFRVRLSTRRAPPFEAGTYVRLKARLLPPSRASLPGGYDFAKDAWFARLGAVGNALGRIEVLEPPQSPGFLLDAMMAIDRGRNVLARRVAQTIGGEAGAIGAAMVTGKRDLLSEDTKEIIREAGIFHIITISGVQMTLVAAIFFVGLRRILSLSQTLALNYPIKKWAAGLAICGAIFYDIVTGSRVGTERALFMTLIMLGSVLLDRQALSMRNLGFAALLIILFEPEAIMGASFQLSFAAVAALVAVYEGRMAQKQRDREYMFTLLAEESSPHFIWHRRLSTLQAYLREGPLAILFATLCATSATASFMASDFHELSPYVLIGNPLTLTVIEVFAVPGAIIGTLLYPLGLDGPVWHYVGAGISFIMMMARFIASLPAATIHLPAFAPWSIIFFALAMLSVVLWHTMLLRMTAIPLAMIGLCGAITGSSFDIAIPPAGDEIAIRGEDGTLSILGPRPNAFAAEQWLRADADGRQVGAARNQGHCDKLGCVARLKDGRPIALVLDRAAFAEDCNRANVIVTPLFAPIGCAAPLVIDRESLKSMGAVTLSLPKGSVLQKTAAGVASDDEDMTWLDDWQIRTARAEGEDRPWSQAPKLQWGQARGATKLQAKLSGLDAPKTNSSQSSQAQQFQPEDEPPENEIDLQLQ